jgi:hypothetical protein
MMVESDTGATPGMLAGGLKMTFRRLLIHLSTWVVNALFEVGEKSEKKPDVMPALICLKCSVLDCCKAMQSSIASAYKRDYFSEFGRKIFWQQKPIRQNHSH